MIFLKLLAAMAITYLSTQGCIFILSPWLSRHKKAIEPCFFFLQFFNTFIWIKNFNL